jgi:hypothetical protein
VLTHLKLLPSKSPPTELTNEALAHLLHKPQLGPNDRVSHNTVLCAQLQEVYDAADRISIELYQGKGQPTTWANVMGDLIPPGQYDEILYKYYSLPTEKDRYLFVW